MTTTAVCPICEAPQGEGIACHSCTSRLERDLGDVAAIVADLDVTLSRQARIGGGGDGKMGKGWAREKLPINIGAIEAADVLTNTLTTWARDVMGDSWPSDWNQAGSRVAARALLWSIAPIRRHAAVDELFDEITDAIRQARRCVDRPADRMYFGACYSETPDEDGRIITCIEEIWASPAASEVTCKVCGAEWEIAERRTWLLRKAADMIVTIPYASEMLGEVGHIKVTQASIRGYVHRKRLAYRAPVEARRFRLGDLLALLVEESEKAERKSA